MRNQAHAAVSPRGTGLSLGAIAAAALFGWAAAPAGAARRPALPPCPPPRCADLPDIAIDGARAAASMKIQPQNFKATDCALVEGCVDAPGRRRLLRFDTVTPNFGAVDLFRGDPRTSPNLFEYSACHGHYHLKGYADYDLLDRAGNVVASGHKQAFCLEDLEQACSSAPASKYTCAYQGITTGWADVYGSYLDCQWVDITDVDTTTQHDFVLRIRVNGGRTGFPADADHPAGPGEPFTVCSDGSIRVFCECNYDDDEVLVPVTIR
jgi:hypothetical protein